MAQMLSKPKTPMSPSMFSSINTNLAPAGGARMSPMPQIQAPNRQIVQTPLMQSLDKARG